MHATFPAGAGGLLVGENEWSCLIPDGKSVRDWEPRALTISLLESEELIPEHEARVAADNEEEKLTRAAAAGDAAAITHVKRRRTKRLWKKAKVIRHVATFGSFAEECAAEDRGAVYAQARFRGYSYRKKDPRRIRINLKVVAQNGNETFFKMKKKTPIGKLMNAYCQRQGVNLNAVRFLFDGERLRESHTPEYLEMEDGDVIDVMMEQVGD